MSVLLAPGAGTDRNHASLVSAAEAITAATGESVARMDFPYRKAGR